MSEEKQVKKQLLKNMILNLVTFSIIFTILGIIIYGQFKSSLYISADSELEKTNTRREFRINNERKLDKELISLKEKEEELKVDANKLQNPEYIARYAREKYLYSKEGEYILQIPEE